MKGKTANLLFLLSLLMTISACQRVFTLQEQEKKLLVYKGFERLIFESDKGEKDTIDLLGYEDYFTTERTQSRNKVKTEHYDLIGVHLDTREKLKDHLRRTFLVALTARETKQTVISFNLNFPGKKYFFWNAIDLDSFFALEDTTLTVDGNIFSDVVIIENMYEKEKALANKQYYISQVFWSISKGFVGFVFSDKTVWQVENIARLPLATGLLK